MADYAMGGGEEENAELKKLNAEVVSFIRSISVFPTALTNRSVRSKA